MFKFIYNGLVKNTGESYFQKTKSVFFGILRKLSINIMNPVISYKLWGSIMKIPLSYNLPIILAQYPNYNINLKRIAGYLRTKYFDLEIIDIGANIGDTVALLKSDYDYKIFSIEGDENFFKLLSENVKQFSNVTLAKNFLGEQNEIIKAKSDSKLGTGNLKESEDQKTEIITLTKLLDKNKDFLNAKLLKTDTDGFDFKIIRGAIDYIKKTNPVIFIEYDPHFLKMYNEDCYSLFNLLFSFGYTKVIFYDSYGDLLISLGVNDKEKIEELTNYFTNRGSLKYCDLCFFHNEDEDLFKKILTDEFEYFKKHRVK